MTSQVLGLGLVGHGLGLGLVGHGLGLAGHGLGLGLAGHGLGLGLVGHVLDSITDVRKSAGKNVPQLSRSLKVIGTNMDQSMISY